MALGDDMVDCTAILVLDCRVGREMFSLITGTLGRFHAIVRPERTGPPDAGCV